MSKKHSKQLEQNNEDKPRNPLNMKKKGISEMLVLPLQKCTTNRKEFLRRSNHILSFYEITDLLSQTGMNQFRNDMRKTPTFSPQMPVRITRDSTPSIETNYQTFEHFYESTSNKLGNYTFVMLYGNFEAFFADQVLRGLNEQGVTDSESETLKLLAQSKWIKKLDRISTKLGVPLGKNLFRQHFIEIDINAGSKKVEDPRQFLQLLADLRHLIVHYSGKVSHTFTTTYPELSSNKGGEISITYEQNKSFYYFLIHLSDAVDRSFCKTFEWKQEEIQPESLI